MMKKLKPLPRKIPFFSTYEEEARFWDSHDTSRLLKEPGLANLSFVRPVKRMISIRLNASLIDALKVLAAKKHLPYQNLIQTLLAEKVQEEFGKAA
ncbi:MAG: hypothetical protein HYZ73_01280 [Elusimicrobia bacterium]|nr:hypothetical protein [Elusimicrobiota bacterium]